MSSASQVEQEVAEPKVAASEPKDKQERERSTIEFPYLSLDVALEIAKAVHETGGRQSQLEQVAAHLKESATGGAFRNKLVTSKLFGLSSHSGNTVTLTQLGARIVDPDQERSARAEAFLTVPLYRAIYEKFQNGTLPPQPGLEVAMVNLGVANKQKERARQAFSRSAKEAGFFAYGSTKLVLPALGPDFKTGNKEKAEEETPPKHREHGSSGNGGGGGTKRHPFIEGLLETLPPATLHSPKVEWSLQDRQEWLQTAAGIFNLIYKAGAEDAGRNVVTVVPLPPSSAK